MPRRCTINCWLALGLTLFVTAPLRGQRDLKNIPDPDPAKELASFRVLPECRVNLFVSDPDIAKPIQMNFDAEGRLWIASSSVYPHIEPGQQANDKILVVEDRDGDGVAEKTTVFADGLLIPTGVLPGDGGCYVANSTELIHLKDTDGDGRADERRVVLSGFGTEDTHHLLHTLRWGPDGAMYMNQSIYIHSHIETPWGVRHLNGGGIWRFEPARMKLEVLAKGFINPWGHHFDAWGQQFATDGAYREGINYVFPGAVFVSSPGASRTVRGLNPGSPKHCGLEILSGRHIPPSWQGLMLTNDFRGNRTVRFQVTERGSGYVSKQLEELIVSSYVSYRPVDIKMGPDGAIYIADWYNPIIQHGEVDFRDPRRDHQHGRVWRVTFPGRDLVDRPAIVGAPIDQLLDLLTAPESWIRLHAKLELKSRPANAVSRAIREWAAQFDTASVADAHHLLEALWASQAIGHIDEDLLRTVLASPEPRARAAAVRVWSLADRDLPSSLQVLETAVQDEFPRVRLEALCALANLPDAAAADLALRALDSPMDSNLDFALWSTLRKTSRYWLPAVRRGEVAFARDRRKLLVALEALEQPAAAELLLERLARESWPGADRQRAIRIIARIGTPDHLATLLQQLDTAKWATPSAIADALAILAAESRTRRIKPAGNAPQLKKWMQSSDPRLIQAVLECGAAWSIPEVAEAAIQRARDAETPLPIRLAAIQALARLDRPDRNRLLRELAQDPQQAVRWQAIAELVTLAPRAAADLAAGELARLSARQDPGPILALFRQRPQALLRLAESVSQKKLHPDIARKASRVAAREGSAGQQLRQALLKAGGLEQNAWKLTPQLMQELIAEVAQHGAPHKGERIYHRAALQCTQCHAIAGVGGKVGPDLISLGASSQLDYIIESLLDPNKKIKENFHSLLVRDVDGRVYTGIPVQRTPQQLTLRDADGKLVAIPVEAIEAEKEGPSLMPEGALNEVTREELVDLIAFLSQLGKPGTPFVAKPDHAARSFEVLEATPSALHRLNRTSFDIAATDDPALTWKPVYATIAGELLLAELPTLKPHRETPPTTFVRTSLTVTQPGKLQISCGSPTGLTLWIDGKPTPLSEQGASANFSAGRHHITLAIDRSQPRETLKLEWKRPGSDGAEATWDLER